MERAQLAAANARSQAVARGWRGSAAVRAIERQFAGVDDDDVGGIARRAHALLEDGDWADALIAPLVDELRRDPWFEPPLRASRDAAKTGAILFDSPAIRITAAVLSADVAASLPPPRSVVVTGRLSVVRYVRSGGGRLRLWHAPPAGVDFDAASAARCGLLGVLPLGDGVVLRLDGRTRGWLVEQASADVVTLVATIEAGQSPVMREYALPGGALLRCATLDDRASRTQMLLTLLRLSGRCDAADQFDAATRDAATFLRWAAMREWLALDARAALPRLREMAADDPDPEIAEAAEATLTMVETRLAKRRCLA